MTIPNEHQRRFLGIIDHLSGDDGWALWSDVEGIFGPTAKSEWAKLDGGYFKRGGERHKVGLSALGASYAK